MTTLLGCFYDKNEQGRETGFTVYYLCKNVGALLAPILCGIVGARYGYNYAFLLSSIGMASGVIVFILGHKHLKPYDHYNRANGRFSKISQTVLMYLGILISVPFFKYILVTNVDGYLLLATSIIVVVFFVINALKRVDIERNRMFAIMIMMLFVVIFSAFLCQGGTTLNLFIDRIVNRHLFGTLIPTPVFYSIDPIFMLSIGPLLALFMSYLAKKNKEPYVTSKFGLALFMLGLGFLVFVVAAYQATKLGEASPLFVVFAYLIFPIAELLIMPVGLAMVTRIAPKNICAMMVGVFMLAQAGGNYLTGQISKLGQIKFDLNNLTALQHASNIYMRAFGISAILLTVAAFILFIGGPFLKRLMNED